ncbi:MAG: alginate lyase family protein [Flavobacteriaceae bacterium]|nr:alginate lyase family protein [Flavobacteriaceae bacterium]
MGPRYLFFRVLYSIKIKLGIHKRKFPVNPKENKYITLKEWRENLPPFFFYGKEIANLPKQQSPELKARFSEIKEGNITFFSKQKINLGAEYDWVTNPSTNFAYDIDRHWSTINDFTKEAGDIKFVWEKARFSYLYDIIRYDYHFEEDQAELVLNEINDFIDKNPINQGPNYKCSQEISLRTLNWTFALYYYKDSEHLTEALFQKIMHVVYWQLHHVYHNIHFSRIAVRNNHAITETLMLYLSEKLFPFFPNTNQWSKKGKSWFEQEIAYQIYEDGTFLQFSMNYHRVVVQLLTWGIQLAKLNNDKFKPVVNDRAKKSLDFLDTCLDPKSGRLPNYGSNDGALFFKLTDDDYRVYRSQLDDLRAVLHDTSYDMPESTSWYGLQPQKINPVIPDELNSFDKGGYYIIQEQDTKTFIRCGTYKDRPFQSDNLHIDIWADGINLLRDSGSYKYNTSEEELNYFTGCEGHNTVSISGNNQMQKGGRFIWYYWVKQALAKFHTDENSHVFSGKIKAFKNLGNNIWHIRNVLKTHGKLVWEVHDRIENIKGKEIYQYWHIHPKYQNKIEITATDKLGNKLSPKIEEKWFSGYYGVKEQSIRLTFATETNEIATQIKIHL